MTTDTDTRPPATSRPRRVGAAGTATAGSVLRWVLRTQRRALVLWSVAVAAVSGIYASFWDVMDAEELQTLIEGMPEQLVVALGYDAIGTAAGYLESTVYGLLGPVLLLVFGIGFAARSIAGHEEDGSLELELTSAVGRRQVLLERYASLVVHLLVFVTVLSAVVIALAQTSDMGVPVTDLLAGGLGLFLLVLAVSTVAFATGAATGRRVIALSVGAGVAVVGFVADALAPLLDNGDWLRWISPFSWYLGGDPLVEGVDPVGFGALAALAVVALTVALVTFERRDLGV